MKFIRLAVLMLLPLISFSQAEVMLKSSIEKVTVYTRGAQVSRKANVTLQKGDNTLVFEKLSPVLDENSLQFSGKGDYSLLSMNFDIRYNENRNKEEIVRLNTQLKDLSDKVEASKDALAVAVSEEQVLVNNTDFDVWEGMNVEQLKSGVNFVRDRLLEIKKRKQQLRNDIDDYNQQRQRIINQLQSARIAEAQPNAVVIVKIKSDQAQNVEAELSYVVADASWTAYYDLRVDNIAEPLQIDYMANVSQNTGEDWDKVKLTLSTGNPYEDGQLPVLNPWYLNYSGNRYSRSVPIQPNPTRNGVTGRVSGVVIDASTTEAIPFANIIAKDQQGMMVAGTNSDMDGRFNLDLKNPATLIEVSFLGYNKYAQSLSQDQFYTIRLSEAAEALNEVVIAYDRPATRRISSESIDLMSTPMFIDGMSVRGSVEMGGRPAQLGDAAFKISQNPINLKFEVNTPYDVPSDGGQYKVKIITYDKEVDYIYQAVPKLNEHAFLTASIVGWENLNLMDGKAGIYYEGNYLGETMLKVSEASDTLKISMGKDKNVVVKRRTIEETSSKKLLSGKVEELFHYQVQVRNNKPAPIRLQIMDQFPVSGNTDIVIEREESSGGKVDDKSGFVTWDLQLEPAQESKLDLIYKVRYPKQRTVNLY